MELEDPIFLFCTNPLFVKLKYTLNQLALSTPYPFVLTRFCVQMYHLIFSAWAVHFALFINVETLPHVLCQLWFTVF